jgi:hypothetical protein
MSKDMKLIMEGWRSHLLENEDEEDFGYELKSGEELPDMPIDSPEKPPEPQGPITFEDVTVGEFLDFYTDVKPKVEFYDKMDAEILSLLEKTLFVSLPDKISEKITDDKRNEIVKFIGKTIRSYVGSLSGKITGATLNPIIKTILEGIMILLDIGDAKKYLVQKSYDILSSNVIEPIVGQYLAEFVEEKISDFIGRFDPDDLGDVKNDAGRVFSVSPAVKNLITNMSDEAEEEISSLHLQNLSRQLKLIGKFIENNKPKAYQGDGNTLIMTSHFLRTPLVKLDGFKDKYGLSGDELALKLVAKQIGAKKVSVVAESKRRRIVYRGKK